MSSLFSDPPFPRGNTLLNNETIDRDVNGTPIAGREIVGSVKVFQDQNPYTKDRLSNRLVYCVAARYKGTSLDLAQTAAARGTVYAFDLASPMAEFTDAATTAMMTAGRAVGVLDEYLTGELREDDIVWIVLKGPTEVKKITSAAINTGITVEVSNTAGSVQAFGSGVRIGQQIAGANVLAATPSARVNLWGVNNSD
jgi:hypothetical protein